MIASSSSLNNPLWKRWIILASLGINKCHKQCQELSFVDITDKNAMLYSAFTYLEREDITHDKCMCNSFFDSNQFDNGAWYMLIGSIHFSVN